jgi:hypothetical protein
MYYDNKIKKNFYKLKLSLFAFLLILSFGFNLFNLVPNGFFDNFEIGSEQNVIGRIENSNLEGLFSNAGLLGTFDQEGYYSPYLGQFGLQGSIFAILDLISFGIVAISTYRIFVAILNVIVLIWLLYYFDKLTKMNVSNVLFLIIFFVSPFLTSMARNLYWVPFTMYLPLLYMFRIYFDYNQNDRLISNKHLIILFLFFNFRFMMGFEFLSTIMISASIPLIFTLNRNEPNYILFLKRFIQYSFTAISSFLFILILHITQKAIYFRSFSLALEHQLINIAKRSNLITGLNIDLVYKESLSQSLTSVTIRYLMNPVLILILLLCAITLHHLYLKIKLKSTSNKESGCYIFSSWVALLAPLSWFVLASGHSVLHTQINYVLWGIPFSLVSTSAIYFYSKKYINYANKIFEIACYVFIIVMIFIGFAFNHFAHSDNYQIRKNAVNFYHEIVVRLESKVEYEVDILEVKFFDNTLQLKIPNSIRYVSLLTINNGLVKLNNMYFYCTFDNNDSPYLENPIILLLCESQVDIHDNEINYLTLRYEIDKS